MDNKTFIKLRDLAYSNIRKKGYYAGEQPLEAYVTAIHEELSEAFKVINKSVNIPWITYIDGKPDGVYFELTDAVIRLLAYCGYMGYDINESEELSTDRPYITNDIFSVINASHATLAYVNSIDIEFNENDILDELNSRIYLDEKVSKEIALNKINAIKLRNSELRGTAIKEFIDRIELFIEQSSENVEPLTLLQLIHEKMEYNKTRPQKHGGNRV